MNNDCVEAVTKELEALGLKFSIEPAGKHQKIYWTVKTDDLKPIIRQYTLPITPSDHRAALNCRSEVRKMLRADGLLKEKSIDEVDPKVANRHLFKKLKRLEEAVEAERRENAQNLKKLHDDFEAMLALMRSPDPAFDARENLQQVRKEVMDPNHKVEPELLAEAQAAIDRQPIPADWEPPQPVGLNKVPQLLIDLLTEDPDWDALEAECAANPRLPPREGYVVLPERYKRINKTKNNPTASPDVEITTPRAYAYEKRIGGKKKNFSPEGLAKLRENALKAREARLAKLAEKKALADKS